MQKHLKDIVVFIDHHKAEKNMSSRVSTILDSLSKVYLVNKYFSLLETEVNFNNIFINTEHSLLHLIKSLTSTFKSCSLVSSTESYRPSTSYTKPISSLTENYLVKLLHIQNVCNDLEDMLKHTTNNEFPSQVLKIYTDIPVEFQIWRHENQVFWARLVHGFYDRIKIKVYTQVSDNSSEEESTNLVIPNWSIS